MLFAASSMSIYYNDNEPYVAQWLRNLIAAGHLPAGEVDDRPIEEVQPDDVASFTQCHFFAGLGGWPYAMRLAGWPDDRPLWTGSCPCQPFSAAGKRQGTADKRHLWPQFYRLIAECRPPRIVGEQVASRLGREWLGGVRADLEALGYAVGAADLCAASVGAPHIRQRLYWVADAAGRDASAERVQRSGQYGQQPEDGSASKLGDAGVAGSRRNGGAIPSAQGEGDSERRDLGRFIDEFIAASSGVGNAERGGCESGCERSAGPETEIATTGCRSFWSRSEWLLCRDGKRRPVEPGIQPLAHGVPARVAKLRAAGNAIIPQIAAEVLKAWMEVAP
jgi:DNA (cytosine-5)-methyltransferase 1